MGDRGAVESAAAAGESLVGFASDKLGALLSSLGEPSAQHPLRAALRRLMWPWGDANVRARPISSSHVADDGAPFEFCVAFSADGPEVQVYVEPQVYLEQQARSEQEASPPSLVDTMNAARAVLQGVAREFRLNLGRYEQVERVLLPARPSGAFALWIGASWSRSLGLQFKAYLNPQVRGVERASEVTTEVMTLLGFERAWSSVARQLCVGEQRRDEIAILCLDLSTQVDARAKVYFRHHAATITEIDAFTALAEDHRPGDCVAFHSSLNNTLGPFARKPAISEFAFVSGRVRPASCTYEFPIGSHVRDDADAAARVRNCLAVFGLPSAPYDRALAAFTQRPLAADVGLHAHVTLRRINGAPRIAVYFASEVYKTKRSERMARSGNQPNRSDSERGEP